MTIKQIAYNYSKRTEPIKYIVIHDTGNTSKGATEKDGKMYCDNCNSDLSVEGSVEVAYWYRS